MILERFEAYGQDSADPDQRRPRLVGDSGLGQCAGPGCVHASCENGHGYGGGGITRTASPWEHAMFPAVRDTSPHARISLSATVHLPRGLVTLPSIGSHKIVVRRSY